MPAPTKDPPDYTRYLFALFRAHQAKALYEYGLLEAKEVVASFNLAQVEFDKTKDKNECS